MLSAHATTAARQHRSYWTVHFVAHAKSAAAAAASLIAMQLVMYPILNLNRHTQDLHWYLRALEEVIIRALANTSGLLGQRIEGLTGVWVDGHKVAAIGVRARKWVTYHGLALNVSTVLQPFHLITPCGISDRPVGNVKTALARSARQDSWMEPQAVTGKAAVSRSSCISNEVGGSTIACGCRGDLHQEDSLQALFAVQSDPLVVEYR